ncbi:MAG: OmpA family protein [Terriglobales bacterium]
MKQATSPRVSTVFATAVALALSLGLAACGHKTVPPPPTPPAPAAGPAPAVTLQATPDSIESGSSSTLAWSSSNAVSVQLNGAAVDLNGSQPVSPSESTSYEVVAASADGRTATAAARVTVTQPPTPEVAPQPTPTNTGSFEEDVHDAFFDFNKSDIRPDAQAALAADATYLKSNPGYSIQVVGHCDARGTAEYNLALGSRRADAVQQFLVSQGVDPNRITTTTVGKEDPYCTDTTEDCYQLNRRGHFVKGGGQ